MPDSEKIIIIRKTRFSEAELAERNRLAGLDAAQAQPVRIYTEAELDELYERDPLAAMRISREQEMARKAATARRKPDPDAPPPDREELLVVLEKARRVLLQDGGDMELVDVQGSIVRVRMKGNCVGCPNSVLDLRNVVEKLVIERFPQVTEVVNTF
jgi:Fe-S cluster biogenesis protein NfuA